jgi:2-methylcitrate dehydratase PrpD
VTVEDTIAKWASELRWDDVPASVRSKVEDMLLDAIASGVAGRSQELVAEIEPVARAFAGDGTAAASTFVEAYRITSATVCDVYRPGLCHTTPVVVPPLLALSLDRDVTGAVFLASLAVGLEVMCRMCSALDYPTLRQRGWHSPGVVGPVGAAAAASRALGLDAGGVRSAMAHGAAQAAGTFASLGTEAVKFNQARGAVSGLLAALMADGGLAASACWLTDPDGGMAHTYTGTPAAPDELVRALGAVWQLEQISLRRWPAASSVQSLIDVCLELDERPETIDSVDIFLSPGAYEVSGDRGWATPLAAQQSARWVASAVLHDRDWWLEQSSVSRIGDADIGAFATERVRVSASPELTQAAVEVRVTTNDGRELVVRRDAAPGDPSEPLTRDQIEDKTRRAAQSAGMAEIAETLIDTVRSLDEAPSAAPLAVLLRSSEALA